MAELQDMRILDPDDPLLEREQFDSLRSKKKAKAASEEQLNYRCHMYDVKRYMVKQEQYRIRKNLLVLCVAFLLNFTAFHSIQTLQSSINSKGGLGLVGLSVIYLSMILSALFLPTICIKRCGCKWSLCLAFLPFVTYMAANYYPTWATIVPTAFFLGLATTVLWAAKGTYLTEIGAQYASLSGEQNDAVVSRFFGYFFMAVQTSQIWGNLITAFILQDFPSNGTLVILNDNMKAKCGKFYCEETEWDVEEIANANLKRPDSQKMLILCGVLTSLALIAFIITAIFLHKLKKRVISDYSELQVYDEVAHDQAGIACRQVVATCRHWRHCNQILLVPLTLYAGLQQGFLIGDFTKSYVSCSLGIWMVAMVFICFGVSNSLFSFIFGRMVKYTGQPLIMSFGAVCHLGSLLGLFFWEPQPGDLYLFFVFATIWGMADAVWKTQIGAFYGCVFMSRKEPAFSNYRLWECVGLAVAFGYSGFLCTYIKICVLLGTLCLGMLGYFIVECRRRCEMNEDGDDVAEERGMGKYGR